MSDTATRTDDLRRMLEERRRVLQDEVQTHLRAGRDHTAEGRDFGEQSAAGLQQHLALTLLELHADTLAHIEDALGRLAAGTYGACATCYDPIAAARLRALPFAVRCQTCEGHREEAHHLARRLMQRRDTLPLFGRIPGS